MCARSGHRGMGEVQPVPEKPRRGPGAARASGGKGWGNLGRTSERSRRELRFFLEGKGPRGENHEVVEVPRLRLAQTAACRNSAVLFWARRRRR